MLDLHVQVLEQDQAPAQEAHDHRAQRPRPIAEDRADCKHSAKELARHLQKPRACDMVNVRILAERLRAPRLCLVAALSEPLGRTDGYSDSEWMGCEETRRNACGCAIYLGGSLVYAAPSTQAGLPR